MFFVVVLTLHSSFGCALKLHIATIIKYFMILLSLPCPKPSHATTAIPADDEERVQKPLLRLRGMGGAATIAVCNRGHDREKESKGDESDSGGSYRGADCVASWRLLAEGAYSL